MRKTYASALKLINLVAWLGFGLLILPQRESFQAQNRSEILQMTS
jgi:hypothetical protein